VLSFRKELLGRRLIRHQTEFGSHEKEEFLNLAFHRTTAVQTVERCFII
jgi:hypothetical protein